MELLCPSVRFFWSNGGGDLVSRIANSYTQEKEDCFAPLAMTKCPGPHRVGKRYSLPRACRARAGLCYCHYEARSAEAISLDNKSARVLNFVKLFKSITQEREQRITIQHSTANREGKGQAFRLYRGWKGQVIIYRQAPIEPLGSPLNERRSGFH